MAREEVMISLGVDNSALHRGLVSARHDVEHTAEHMTSSLKNALHGFRPTLIAGGLTHIFGIADSLSDSMVEFYNRAKELGKDWAEISVGGFKALGKLAETSSAEFEKRSEIARKLNKARWDEATALEKEFREKTDRNIEAEKNAKIESMSAAQKEAEFEKEKVQLTGQHAANEIQISRIKKEIASGDRTNENRLQTYVNSQLDIEKDLLDVGKKQRDNAEERAEIKRKEVELSNEQLQKEKQIRDTAKQSVHDDKIHSTIEELAGQYGFGSKFHGEAQRILQLEKFEQYNRSGFRDSDLNLANRQQEERINLIGNLIGKDVLANNPVVDAIDKFAKQMNKPISVKELQGDD